MKKDMYERLAAFYGGDIPGYILDAGETSITLHAGVNVFGDREVTITMDDIADYYRDQAGDATHSGCRTLAGMAGDWRPIDMMARECLKWFKTVNIAGMRRAVKKTRRELPWTRSRKKNGVFLMRGKGHSFEQFKTALMQRLEDEGFFEEEDTQPQSKPLKTTGTKTKKVRNTPIRSATEEDYKNRQNWSVGTFHRISTPTEMEQ